MKLSWKFIFLLFIHLTCGQLNFEGNPLTENTDYLAEESQISTRTSRQNNLEKSINNNEINQPQKLYPVYNNDAKNISHEKSIVNNSSQLNLENKNTIQVVKLVPTTRQQSRQLHDNYININPVQQEQNSGQSPADLALHIFMNSKTPQESEMALNYYLQGGQGLNEQLELQKQQQIREKELQQEQYLRQQEQLLQRQKQQQLQQEHLLLQEQENQILAQNHQDQSQQFQNIQSQHLNNQIQQNQLNIQQIKGQNQFQNLNQYQNQNQFQSQPIGGYYQPHLSQRIPLIQSRNDYPMMPMYRRPMKRINYRQSFQSRIGPPLYKGPPPPMSAPIYPGKMMKPPVEVIYSRPPNYARGAPIVSNPPIYYEDASPWFPEVEHKPPSKDIYYSQLYAQSYDPHYYNYIAKTGKIKPHLYGKLNNEIKEDDGILAELFRGFTKHGMKNIMNPTFLLGMTIPALTFMLTALVQKRSLARSDSRSLNEDEIHEYVERLKRSLECYRNLKVPTDDRCWR